MRRSGYALLCAGVTAAIATPGQAQDFSATAINEYAVTDYDVYGGASGQLMDNPALPGGKALRVTIPARGANPWDAGVVSKITGPLKAGEEVALIFYAKLHSGENGAPTAVLPSNNVSLASPPYTALFSAPATIGSTWKRLRLPWIADKDYAAGTLQAGLQLASAKQVVDLGPIYFTRVGMAAAPTKTTVVEDLSSKIANDPAAPEVNGARGQLVDDPKVDGGKALRVSVSKKGANNWASVVESSVKKPVRKGDKLVLMFSARLQEGPAGAATATIPAALVQMKAAPYSSIVNGQPALTGGWQSYRFEGTATQDHAADALKASIQLGNARQTVDLGPIIVLNMGQ